MNIYKLIADSDTPLSLLSLLSDRLCPIPESAVSYSVIKDKVGVDEKENGVYANFLHFFQANQFYFRK